MSTDEFKLVAKVEVNTAKAVASIENLDARLEKLTRARQIKGVTNLQTIIVALNNIVTDIGKVSSATTKQSTQLTEIKNAVLGVKTSSQSATTVMKAGFKSVNSTLSSTNSNINKVNTSVKNASTSMSAGFSSTKKSITSTKNEITKLGTTAGYVNRNLKKGFSSVNTSVNSFKSSVKSATSSMKSLNSTSKNTHGAIRNGAKTSASSMDNLSKATNNSRGSFLLIPKIIARISLSIYILEQAFRQVSKVVESVFAPAINVSAELETNILGVAGILTSIGTIDGNPITDINDALAISTGMMDKLRGKAIASSATFQELAETFKTNLGFGLKLGFDEDQTMEATVVISNAVKTMMGAMGTQRQLVQESKSLLNPNQGIKSGTDSLATSLGITTQLKQQWLAEGNYYEKLMERFAGFKKMSGEFNKTYAGSLSNLQDAFEGILALTSRRMFTSVTDDILELQSLFMEVKDGQIVMSETGNAKFDTKVVETATKFYDGLGAMVRRISPIIKDSFTNLLGFLDDISGTLPDFGVGLVYVFAGVMEVLGNFVALVIEVATILGEGMSPAFDMVVDGANLLIDSFKDMVEDDRFVKFLDGVKVLVNILALAFQGLCIVLATIPEEILNLIEFLGALWDALAGIISFLVDDCRPALIMISLFIGAIAVSMMSIPVMIALGVGALVGAFVLFQNTLDSAFKSTAGKFDAFKKVLSNFFSGKYSGIGEAFDDYNRQSAKVEKIYGSIWENGSKEATASFAKIKSGFTDVQDAFNETFISKTKKVEASKDPIRDRKTGKLGNRNSDEEDEDAESNAKKIAEASEKYEKEKNKALADIFNTLMANYNNSYTDFNERRKKIDNEYAQSVKAIESVKEAQQTKVSKLKEVGLITDLKATDVLREADNAYYSSLMQQETIRQEKLKALDTLLVEQQNLVLKNIDAEKLKTDKNHESRMKQLVEYYDKVVSLQDSNDATTLASKESKTTAEGKIDLVDALQKKMKLELHDALATSIESLVSGDGSFSDVIKAVGTSIGSTMATAWADSLATNLNKLLEPITEGLSSMFSNLIGGLFGGSGGGSSSFSFGDTSMGSYFAEGGHVTGAGTSTSDSIPAMLSDGEFVLNAKAVERIGISNLNAMNKGLGANLSGGALKFASGGLVKATQGSSTSNTSNNSSNVVYAPNVTVSSSSGEDVESKVYKALAQSKEEFLDMVKKSMSQDSGMRDAIRGVR